MKDATREVKILMRGRSTAVCICDKYEEVFAIPPHIAGGPLTHGSLVRLALA